MTLKMSTLKWVHVLLLQLNSGISLPSPDLCNSAAPVEVVDESDTLATDQYCALLAILVSRTSAMMPNAAMQMICWPVES